MWHGLEESSGDRIMTTDMELGTISTALPPQETGGEIPSLKNNPIQGLPILQNIVVQNTQAILHDPDTKIL